MRILFVHQNFPGQFRFLAPALAADPVNRVLAMTMQKVTVPEWKGVGLVPYSASRGTTKGVHPWLSDFETKTLRAEACFRAALQLKSQGFNPDVIIAHPGWGESLFLKDVWTESKLGIYCEFYYTPEGADVGFDPEFASRDEGDACRLRLKNINNLLHFQIADAAISPTEWQATTFPEPFRSKITIVHDGIDTVAVAPDSRVSMTFNGDVVLTKQDEVITFVNRNLEPYRGYHVFMRALPEILRRRTKAHVLIVGGDRVSYGAAPGEGRTWKEIFIAEVRSEISESEWKRVHFTGTLPSAQFIRLLQLSTVHVYLTYPFVLSWSLLEAMSAGCAIVASDTRPLHEVLHHDENGRLVNFFDLEALVHEVCLLLDNPALQEKYGSNARTSVQAGYDLKSVCLPRQIDWVKSLIKSV